MITMDMIAFQDMNRQDMELDLVMDTAAALVTDSPMLMVLVADTTIGLRSSLSFLYC